MHPPNPQPVSPVAPMPSAIRAASPRVSGDGTGSLSLHQAGTASALCVPPACPLAPRGGGQARSTPRCWDFSALSLSSWLYRMGQWTPHVDKESWLPPHPRDGADAASPTWGCSFGSPNSSCSHLRSPQGGRGSHGGSFKMIKFRGRAWSNVYLFFLHCCPRCT